ncbi:MAG: hypothetical protein WKF92_05530 [Pyrinomonadaceae bacterium]
MRETDSPTENIFNSWLIGGFECSTHRNKARRRLDLIASTLHDKCAFEDYSRLIETGIQTARDGLRWHLIELEPGKYDFSSLELQAEAARRTGIQVIWDYFHYGYPDDLDIYSSEFPSRFAEFAAAATEYLNSKNTGTIFICPVNEISFFSWIAGDIGRFYPYAKRRGDELKRILVRTSIAAMEAILSVTSDVRFVHTEPAIHVVGGKNNPHSQRLAERYRRAQFHGLDMIAGRREPELGGSIKYLDIIGLNYYFHNQWRYPNRRKIPRGHADYIPLRSILKEFNERYGRPVLIAETGAEDDARRNWFKYVCEEVRAANASGMKIEGVCLYPVVNHPGWEDDRHCHNGLWDYADGHDREIYSPLAEEIAFQQLLDVRVSSSGIGPILLSEVPL